MRTASVAALALLGIFLAAGCGWFDPPTKDECENSFNRFLDACGEKIAADNVSGADTWATVARAAGKAGVKMYVSLQQKDEYVGKCLARPRLGSPFTGAIDLKNSTIGQFCNVKGLTLPAPK